MEKEERCVVFLMLVHGETKEREGGYPWAVLVDQQ